VDIILLSWGMISLWAALVLEEEVKSLICGVILLRGGSSSLVLGQNLLLDKSQSGWGQIIGLWTICLDVGHIVVA
jgi:hypothetical protein